jgi:TRAP-type mannitol/chloroaromatic compound transport system permease small subunit
MGPLLAFSRAVDRLNTAVAKLATCAVLLAAVISAGNALVRYSISYSSNAWLEVQWYLFGAVFMLGTSYTLFRNEHVRVDLLYNNVSERTRLWIDVFGFICFLLPAVSMLAWMTYPMFVESLVRQEGSPNAGGLLRWPVKILLPIGFGLLTLQGLSELIKRIALLRGLRPAAEVVVNYQRPDQ